MWGGLHASPYTSLLPRRWKKLKRLLSVRLKAVFCLTSGVAVADVEWGRVALLPAVVVGAGQLGEPAALSGLL